MNILTIALTVLSLSASNLASMGRSRNSNDDKWTQSDMETWEEFGRWRRAHPRYRDGRDGRDYDSERDGRRWSDDRDRRERERGRDYPRDRNTDKDRDNSDSRKPYPPSEVMPPSRQPQPPVVPEPEEPKLNPLPIIIEPIRPMPSIIEPYPVVVESTSSVGYPVTHSTDSYSYYSQTTEYYSSMSASSVYHPSPSTSKAAVVSRKYTPASNATTSSMVYASTSIVTVPESTVTTKVTGRYRAMSNAAAGVGNNVAGSISFGLVLFSSLFLLLLV